MESDMDHKKAYEDFVAKKDTRVPEGETAPERLANLKEAAKWQKDHVHSILETRPDGEFQKDHLFAVERNTREIYEDLVGRQVTEEEKLLIQLQEDGHDRGKWEFDRVSATYRENPQLHASIIDEIGISEIEKGFLEKGIDDHFHRKDIAHDIASAYLFALDARGETPLAKLDDSDKKLVTGSILSHQFGHYYRKVAQNEGYSPEEIDAVQRELVVGKMLKERGIDDIKSSEDEALINDDYKGALKVRKKYEEVLKEVLNSAGVEAIHAVSLHDGDKLSMTEVGMYDQDGKFVLGGFGKIVMINVRLVVGRADYGISEMDGIYESVNGSVNGVGEEIITPKAREMFSERVHATSLLVERLKENPFFAENVVYTDDLEKQKEVVARAEKIVREESERVVGNRS